MSWLLIASAAFVAGTLVPLLWRWCKRRPDLKGKVVFITGGSEGIGKALGLDFVRRGADVVLMARTAAKLSAAAAELSEARRDASQRLGTQIMDVMDFASVQAGMKQAAQEYGSPSFLITCAGAASPGYFLDQEVAVFKRTMDLNYMGNVHAIKAVAPMMKDNGGGHIMIVASAAAVVSFIGYSSYSPSKFALRGLADALRSELSGFGIRVAICYPPDTETPGFREENKTKPPETLACFPADAYPADRVAAKSVDSLLLGDYHIQSVDVLQNMLVSSMAGVTPRPFMVFEMLLQPILALVSEPFRLWFDYQARKYASKVQGASKKES